MGRRSGHDLHKWGDLPQTLFSRSLMGRCGVLPGSLSMHKSADRNVMEACVLSMRLGSVIAEPVPFDNRAWGTERPRRSHAVSAPFSGQSKDHLHRQTFPLHVLLLLIRSCGEIGVGVRPDGNG